VSTRGAAESLRRTPLCLRATIATLGDALSALPMPALPMIVTTPTLDETTDWVVETLPSMGGA